MQIGQVHDKFSDYKDIQQKMSNIYDKNKDTGMSSFNQKTFQIKETVIDPDAIGKTFNPNF